MAFVGVGSVGSHLRGSGLRWEGLERRNGGIRAMTAPTVSLRGRVGLRMAADEFDDLAAQMAKDLGLGGATDAPESEGNLPVVVSAEGGLPAVVLEHKATKQVRGFCFKCISMYQRGDRSRGIWMNRNE